MTQLLQQLEVSIQWWWNIIEWAGWHLDWIIFIVVGGLFGCLILYGLVNATINHLEMAQYHAADQGGDIWVNILKTLIAWGVLALFILAILVWL